MDERPFRTDLDDPRAVRADRGIGRFWIAVGVLLVLGGVGLGLLRAREAAMALLLVGCGVIHYGAVVVKGTRR